MQLRSTQHNHALPSTVGHAQFKKKMNLISSILVTCHYILSWLWFALLAGSDPEEMTNILRGLPSQVSMMALDTWKENMMVILQVPGMDVRGSFPQTGCFLIFSP